MKPRLLWITDPWNTLDHGRDTTLRLIEESLAMGIESHWCDLRSIRIEGGRTRLTHAQVLEIEGARSADSFRFSPPKVSEPHAFTHVFYRTDPPVDLAYILPLQLLRGGVKGKRPRFVNPIDTLLLSNEKTEAQSLGRLFPPGAVSSDPEVLLAFARKTGRTVFKPLYLAQSKGVVVVDAKKSTDASLRSLLGKLTEGGTLPAQAQKYLAGIERGEKRLWFAGGRYLACVRKKPRAGEAVIDMDRGGTLERVTLTASEKKSAAEISRHLRKHGISWAAVDLIDGYVTDFNFTSPGLISQMETLLKRNLAREILTRTLKK